jgi:DNA-directed RNA polymerase beta subunit
MGEMEIECNWAHGCLQFLKERIINVLDTMSICRKQCGMIAIVNPEKNIHTCRNCKILQLLRNCIPYAAKLFQEVQTMVQHVHYIKKIEFEYIIFSI